MTKEEFNILSKYENNFNTAIRSNYIRNIPSKELNILLEIYQRNLKLNNYKLCKHCSADIIQFFKNLGKLYFTEKNKREMKKENGKTRKSE